MALYKTQPAYSSFIFLSINSSYLSETEKQCHPWSWAASVISSEWTWTAVSDLTHDKGGISCGKKADLYSQVLTNILIVSWTDCFQLHFALPYSGSLSRNITIIVKLWWGKAFSNNKKQYNVIQKEIKLMEMYGRFNTFQKCMNMQRKNGCTGYHKIAESNSVLLLFT